MIERNTIREFVLNMGITPELNGHEYIIEAIEKLIVAPKTNLTELYSDIAKFHNVSGGSVGRAIRYAIITICNEYGGIKRLEKILHCPIYANHLKNSKFLALCVETLKSDEEQ